jgi:RPA family protein
MFFLLLFVGNYFPQRKQFPTNNKENNFLQTTGKTISYKQQRKQFPTNNKEINCCL